MSLIVKSFFSPITFRNAARSKSMIPKPVNFFIRCASAIISGKYFCKSTGTLYHGNSYAMSPNRRNRSVVNEPMKQYTSIVLVLACTTMIHVTAVGSMFLNVYKWDAEKRQLLYLCQNVFPEENRTASILKLFSDMKITPMIN